MTREETLLKQRNELKEMLVAARVILMLHGKIEVHSIIEQNKFLDKSKKLLDQIEND